MTILLFGPNSIFSKFCLLNFVAISCPLFCDYTRLLNPFGLIIALSSNDQFGESQMSKKEKRAPKKEKVMRKKRKDGPRDARI